MTQLSLSEAHAAAEASPGVILFTVSVIADGATSMARVYSSHPDVYPVGGRKTLDGQTSPVWYEQVVEGRAGHVLRSYAGVNPAEFFAVATEAFFDAPIELRDEHPDLYEVLSGYYHQDPATRAARSS